VGLINSTEDLSGPAARGSIPMEDTVKICEESPEQIEQRARRKQRSAVGTPDYLAPEILLGTSHGPAADWWSTGVMLFEMLTGIPPFNAEHPQVIFDNILNRNIPWPHIPEDMSPEAQDLIDKLLTEDPNERLGAKGATEVKAHPFFKNINWDTLARQKVKAKTSNLTYT
jgi:serine/threonine protein kinase